MWYFLNDYGKNTQKYPLAANTEDALPWYQDRRVLECVLRMQELDENPQSIRDRLIQIRNAEIPSWESIAYIIGEVSFKLFFPFCSRSYN
jgi:hypothetical protein